ncbi:MAG: aspartate aminotransferase family protein [Gammaproteobacteria bacterium]|nr:aspartate aminotransferase family protein [Gammaproteobacteria bacterium]
MSKPVLMNTYAQLPVTFTRGEGPWLWDEQGRRYLDGLCGIGVTGLGHAHPRVTQAICEQAGRLLHTSNLYGIEVQQQLGERLCRLSGMDRVFFANSGAEANEALIKLARLHGHQQGIENPAVIVMENSFHGRTMATLTATGNRKVQVGFEPLVQGFIRAPYNDLAALKTIAENSQNVVAVLLEPIQGEGGINIPDADYLAEVRALCDQQGWLMMLDEVQTGVARTGEWFAFQHSDSVPDAMALAKGLGNGVPIGACLARGAAAELMQPGHHGSTFGGNPLVCRAALAVLDTIEEERLLPRIQQMGEALFAAFSAELSELEGVLSIRCAGLMVGITLDRDCPQLVQQALEAGLLINVTAGSTVRLLPPFILSDDELNLLVEGVCSLIKTVLTEA